MQVCMGACETTDYMHRGVLAKAKLVLVLLMWHSAKR